MSRRTVDLDGVAITVSPLEAPRTGLRQVAIMAIEVIDGTTGRRPLAPISAAIIEPATGCRLHGPDNGLVGITGRPAKVFATAFPNPARIAVRIAAPGFVTRIVTVDFAVQARTLTAAPAGTVLTLSSAAGLGAGSRLLVAMPDSAIMEIGTVATPGPGIGQVTLLQPLSASYPAGAPVQPLPHDQRIELTPMAVMLAGRVTRLVAGAPVPIVGGAVTLAKLWRQAPPAGVSVPPEPPVPGVPPPPTFPAPILAIHPPLYADVPAGALMEIEDRPLDGAFVAKRLHTDTAADSERLAMSDWQTIAVGDVLAIDDDDDDRRELFEVTSLPPPGSSTASPGLIGLDRPTAMAHRAGCPVRRLGAPSGAASVALNYPGAAGDTTLLLDTTGLAGGHQIRIVDPGPPAHSYHRMALYDAVTDADGYFRLPPLTRTGRIELHAQNGTATLTADHELVPDYRLPINQHDMIVG